jgi:hypothetical protein
MLGYPLAAENDTRPAGESQLGATTITHPRFDHQDRYHADTF